MVYFILFTSNVSSLSLSWECVSLLVLVSGVSLVGGVKRMRSSTKSLIEFTKPVAMVRGLQNLPSFTVWNVTRPKLALRGAGGLVDGLGGDV